VSEQNLEVSRRINDLWNAGDMEGIRELVHDDAVMHHPEGWPEPGPSVGRDAVFRQFDLLRQAWRSDRLETLDRRAAGDCVVVQQRWLAQGDHSGATSEMLLSSVARYRDGMVVEITFYWDHAEALAAAGVVTDA
jgi:ketosteroid isomerase-like protein